MQPAVCGPKELSLGNMLPFSSLPVPWVVVKVSQPAACRGSETECYTLESTALASLSTLTHHGIIYVPLGYKPAFPLLSNLQEIHGGKWFDFCS